MAENTNDTTENKDGVVFRDVIIIGSGPAGYTAALYLGRAGYKPLVITGALNPGGELVRTTTVENFPGFPDGVQGPDLMDAMQRQAEKFGAEFDYDDVASVDLTGDIKKLTTDSGTRYGCRAVIIATGSTYRKLGAPGEQEYSGHGVSYCATCDGFFFTGKKIAVLGGGDSAMTDADFLSRFGSSVTVIHRRDQFRASKAMVDRVKANGKVSFLMNTVVTEILGDGEKVTGLALENTATGEESTFSTDAIFIAIGSDPQTAFLGGQVELDHGYIVTEGSSSRTNLPGVFAAGDVADPIYRQAVSAAGMGCRAALDAQRYLTEDE
ncbi:MAG: thioredoxin-disulfide reductase [Aeriscardovia sp.]|nr:thioredoxin-disulfide reductase [Aeriscardovia sp.]